MRPWRPVVGLIVLLLVMSGSAVPIGAPKDDAFTLAVVRRDAIVIPFATYDGKRWKNAWPLPQSRITAPITLGDIPKRWWTGRDPIGRWTFFPIRGASREIETQGTAWFPSHCSQAIGLRTNYTAGTPPPPPNVQPYPKDGLAVSGPAKIAPIEIVEIASSPLARDLEAWLGTPVYEDETKTVKRYVRTSPGWSHSYTDDERKHTPVRLEALYRVPRGLGDRDVYYFEALKHYAVRESSKDARRRRDDEAIETARARTRTTIDTGGLRSAPDIADPQQPLPAVPSDMRDRPPTAGTRASAPAVGRDARTGPTAAELEKAGFAPCDLITFVSGWLAIRGDERISPLTLNVAVTSCDLASAFIMLPLGVVHVKDKALWAVQWSGWTHEHYSVLDVQQDRVMTVTWARGGNCAAER